MTINLTEEEASLVQVMLRDRLIALNRQLDPEWRKILQKVGKKTDQEEADFQCL